MHHSKTFRLVFNAYFNADYPLLEDISYVLTSERSNEFVVFRGSRPIAKGTPRDTRSADAAARR